MITVNLIEGDCLEAMDNLIEKNLKVDLIATDPPYGKTACKWDTVIPFKEMWLRLNKLIKPNGAIVLFGSEPFSSTLRISNLKNYKYDIIWDKIKGTGFLNAKKQPMRNHEVISVFYQKQPTYNPKKTEGHIKKTSFRAKHHQTDVYGEMKNDYQYNSTERYPKSIQSFSTDTQNSSLHPTQKPIALMEYIIKTYTNEDEIVLDFTMGSGSTGVACKNTNRNFIGIELDKNYFNIAKNRINSTSNINNLL